MISRLTTYAVAFAVLTGASIALATTVSSHPAAHAAAPAATPVRVIELPRVVVTARRLPA